MLKWKIIAGVIVFLIVHVLLIAFMVVVLKFDYENVSKFWRYLFYAFLLGLWRGLYPLLARIFNPGLKLKNEEQEEEC